LDDKQGFRKRLTAGRSPIHHDRLSNGGFVLVVLFVVIGLVTLVLTKAAVGTASIEPETKTLSANSQSYIDNGASNNGYVRFTAPVSAYSGLHTAYPDAFVKPDGTVLKINGVNIRNIGMYSIPTICGGPGWTQLKQQGFNTVRLAVSWPTMEPSQGLLDATALAKLDGAISSAKSAGLYVILDGIHANSGPNMPAWVTGSDDVDKVNQAAAWYWGQLAGRYKSDDNVIAYDLVNEPHSNVDDNNRILSMYQGLISTIRAIDANKILIFEANSGDHTWINTNWGILTNKTNLIASHHSYWGGGDDDGYSSSGWPVSQNQLWSGTVDYSPTATSASEIAAHFDKMLNMLATPRLPLFLGEYGIYRDGAHARQFITDNVSALNARNIPRTAWEGYSGGSFSLCRQDSNTWVNFIDAFAW
jgi:hypothetical protein